MSEPTTTGPEKTAPAKKPISPTRNILGLIVLAAVLAFGWFEYTPKSGFNAAVAKLEARTLDEDKGLMTIQEAESLLGKEADGPAVDFNENSWNFSKKTYTWKGLIKHYTVTAYYTKEKDSRLHHFETEGTKVDLSPRTTVTAPAGGGGGGGGGRGGRGGGGGGKSASSSTGSPGDSKNAPDSKTQSSAPSDKAATPKAEPSDKAAAPKTESSEKAPAPKTEPPSNPATKGEPAKPSGKPGESK